MSRLAYSRSFSTLAKAALAAFLALASGAGSATPATKILKFGYILSSDSQLGAGEKIFAAEVAARTNGHYTIEDYPDAMLGGEVAMMSDVRLDALDLALSDEDKTAFTEAAKAAARESRKIASEKEETGIAALRAKGMTVIETIDEASFITRVSEATPIFEKKFGHDAIERIRYAAAASHKAASGQVLQ